MVFIKDRCVSRYLGRLSDPENVGSILAQFFTWIDEEGGEFSGLSLGEILAYQKANPGSYEVVDLIEGWLDSRRDLWVGSQRTYYARVKGLFLHNRVTLPEDPAYRVQSDVEPVEATLTFEESPSPQP